MGWIWHYNQQIRFGILLLVIGQYDIGKLFICHFSGAECSKKWINIKDMFIKQSKKLGTGSATQSKTRRNEMLSFLDGTVLTNKQWVNFYVFKFKTVTVAFIGWIAADIVATTTIVVGAEIVVVSTVVLRFLFNCRFSQISSCHLNLIRRHRVCV